MTGQEYHMHVLENAPGRSGIFNFPFRIYADEELISVEAANESFRYRVTFIPKNDSSTRRVVPSIVWPNFKNHPSLKDNISIDSASMDLVYGNTKFTYSQMRLDIWGNLPEEEIHKFSAKFLNLIRLYTDQYWINSYEYNFNLTFITSLFPIDEEGSCIVYPSSVQKICGANFRPLNNEYLKGTFLKAVSGEEVHTYWLLYFESVNLMVREFIDQAVLLLTLSLEVARNVNFVRFASVKKETVAGITFDAPFDDTDLLKNLSVNLKKAIGRSMIDEKPKEWESIRKLYVARHQVAHGKKASYFEGGVMKAVENDIFLDWARDVRNTLAWLIELNN